MEPDPSCLEVLWGSLTPCTSLVKGTAAGQLTQIERVAVHPMYPIRVG
jgi:hypothetical protein